MGSLKECQSCSIFFLSICFLFLSSCADRKLSSSAMVIPKNFDWQGHRGCRGLMPENTVIAFLEALKYPVTTLEMDVVISKEGEIIVSHDPWMDHEICMGPGGEEITAANERQHNIFTLTLAEIRKYDCGKKGNPKFPRQQKIPTTKPTLSIVVNAVKEYCRNSGRLLPGFNIEIKSHEAGYGSFVPYPKEFVARVLHEIISLEIEPQTTLQSFDLQVLRELHTQMAFGSRISYLVESGRSIEEAIAKLGFTPQIYSPHHRLVSKKTITYAQAHNISVIPWTVNDTKDFRKLIRLGVDGIITDYPDLIETLNQK